MPKRSLWIVAALLAASAAPAAANPLRLQLQVKGPMVTAGGTCPVTVVFLDRGFRPVPNDRERTVHIDLLSTGDGSPGRAEIVPARIKVAAGAVQSDVRLVAKSAGSILLRATSDGLAPGEAVVRIRGGSASLLRWFEVPVHAQEPPVRQLQPARHEPFPLNHASMAQFSIIPSVPIQAGSRVSFRLDAEPAVPIRYGDREIVGSMMIHLAAGQDQSGPIYVLPPSHPSRIQVRAQELPHGPAESVEIEFVAPRPVSIGFDRESYTAKPDHRIVPVNVQLRDKDLIPLSIVGEPRDVTLESAAGSSWRFEPTTVRLSAASPVGASKLHLPWFRFGRDVRILVESDSLTTGQADVRVMATEFALIALALVGGFAGGLARHVYIVGTPRILPGRVRGRLDPGLIGNALFSALSGVVLFKAVDVGIVHVLPVGSGLHDTAALGFVLGVTGGFAGVLVFETLIERTMRAREARLETAGA